MECNFSSQSEPFSLGGGHEARSSDAESACCKRRKLPPWTKEEEYMLGKLHCELGSSWASIAEQLPGRTAIEAKNIWYSTLRSNTSGRSFLLEYIQAIQDSQDAEARKKAFRKAVLLHGKYELELPAITNWPANSSCNSGRPTAEQPKATRYSLPEGAAAGGVAMSGLVAGGRRDFLNARLDAIRANWNEPMDVVALGLDSLHDPELRQCVSCWDL